MKKRTIDIAIICCAVFVFALVWLMVKAYCYPDICPSQIECSQYCNESGRTIKIVYHNNKTYISASKCCE